MEGGSRVTAPLLVRTVRGGALRGTPHISYNKVPGKSVDTAGPHPAQGAAGNPTRVWRRGKNVLAWILLGRERGVFARVAMANPVRTGSAAAVAFAVVAALCGSGDAFVVGGGGAVAPWRAAHSGTTVSYPMYRFLASLVWLSRRALLCPHGRGLYVCSQRVVVWAVGRKESVDHVHAIIC